MSTRDRQVVLSVQLLKWTQRNQTHEWKRRCRDAVVTQYWTLVDRPNIVMYARWWCVDCECDWLQDDGAWRLPEAPAGYTAERLLCPFFSKVGACRFGDRYVLTCALGFCSASPLIHRYSSFNWHTKGETLEIGVCSSRFFTAQVPFRTVTKSAAPNH